MISQYEADFQSTYFTVLHTGNSEGWAMSQVLEVWWLATPGLTSTQLATSGLTLAVPAGEKELPEVTLPTSTVLEVTLAPPQIPQRFDASILILEYSGRTWKNHLIHIVWTWEDDGAVQDAQDTESIQDKAQVGDLR